MLQIKKYSNQHTQFPEVQNILKTLHQAIFMTPEGCDLNDIAQAYAPDDAASKRVLIYFDEEKPVGFLCMQRYEIKKNDKTMNVFRGQAGLLSTYRKSNLLKFQYIYFIISQMLRHPAPSYFFAVCLHPSSYRAITRYAFKKNTWPTRLNLDNNTEMQDLCTLFSQQFNYQLSKSGHVFIYNDGLGGTRGCKHEHDNMNEDAAFFLNHNAGYINGDGMLVIAKITVFEVFYRLICHTLGKMNRNKYIQWTKQRQQ